MKFKFLIVFFILLSCDNAENQISKNIENCADNSWKKNEEYRKIPAYEVINDSKKSLKNYKDEIIFLENQKAFFIDQKKEYEKERDAAILIKKKIRKKLSYAQELNYEYRNNKKMSSYRKKDIDYLKNRAKENSDYYVSYENTVDGFTKRIKELQRFSVNAQDKINDLRTSKGIKKHNKAETKKYNEYFKDYLKPFLGKSLKDKLKDSSFNSRFIACEILRKRSPIAFDERWR
jgi:hypothetical protein